MSGPKFGVQASAFGESIYVGKLNAGGDLFLQKESCTDMVLAAVAQYTSRNFDGGMTVEFPRLDGGTRLTVTVEPLDEVTP